MKEALDAFGEVFIQSAFDRTMKKYGDIVFQKRIRGITAQFLNEQLSGFSEEQRKATYLVLEKAIEDMACNMLDLFEQNADFQLAINVNEQWINLSEVSDGLSGELFGASGWINKYSSVVNDSE